MAVSVSNTAYGIIADAMHDAGLLAEGDEPNSEQLASNMRRLCDLINVYQLKGIKLFLTQEYSITLVAGTNSYTVNPTSGLYPTKHLSVLGGRVQDSDGNKRPMNAISWEEWNRLSENAEGAIVGYFADKQATSLVVKVWNTPDSTEAANTLILTIRSQAANPDNLEGNVSFPQEWRMALRWGLAADICTGQPSEVINRCEERANRFMEILEDYDVEDAPTRFAPDFRGYSAGGGFR